MAPATDMHAADVAPAMAASPGVMATTMMAATSRTVATAVAATMPALREGEPTDRQNDSENEGGNLDAGFCHKNLTPAGPRRRVA